MRARSVISHIWALKSIWVTVLAVLLPLNLVLYQSDSDEPLKSSEELRSRCAYVIVVMAVLWLTEAIPIPVTALMPIFLFPLTGVLPASVVSATYVSDTTMLFLGGLVIAVALEETGLHTRISLCVMLLVGARPIMLMLGLMLTTWFLSMWISNTAAASMMIPIITAVSSAVREVKMKSGVHSGHENEAYDMEGIEENNGVKSKDNKYVINKQTGSSAQERKSTKETTKGEEQNENLRELSKSEENELRRLSKGLALSVAYGANIGGIATLTGTPPNLVLKNVADEFYAQNGQGDSPISFAKWMGFAFPMSLITLFIGWLWLALVFLRLSCFRRMGAETKLAIGKIVRDRYKKLGRISMAETQVLVVFIFLVILWLFRAPPNIDGWGIGFKKDEKGKSYVSDSTACILLSVVLFLLPAEKPNIFCWFKGGRPSYNPILKWAVVANKLPWGVIVLLGGGFAIAKGSDQSGLSEWLGNELTFFQQYDPWVMNLIISLIVAGATEVTSNTATAQLLLPVLRNMSISIGIHPLYLMISATIACSFAFMLPVATPPNAIVFSTGVLSIPDMALAGLPMNIIAIMCLTFAINAWGKPMFDLDTFPSFIDTDTRTTILTSPVWNTTTPAITTVSP